MYVEKDYVLRLIHEIVRTLFKLLFGKEIEEEKDRCLSPENEQIYSHLIHMIENGEINSAENSLMNGLNLNDRQYFQFSLWFYEYLNGKDDSFLIEHNFSREEILEGLRHIVDLYGYGTLIQLLSEEAE